MTFLYTDITAEMVKKYDMGKDYSTLIEHQPKDFYTYGKEEFWGVRNTVYTNLEEPESRKIVIDEENNHYFRYGGRGFGEFIGITGHTYCLLYWQGQRIYFVDKTIFVERDEKKKFASIEIIIQQLNSLQPIRFTTELFQFIENALRLYKTNVNNWDMKINFNFRNFESIN